MASGTPKVNHFQHDQGFCWDSLDHEDQKGSTHKVRRPHARAKGTHLEHTTVMMTEAARPNGYPKIPKDAITSKTPFNGIKTLEATYYNRIARVRASITLKPHS